MRWTKFYEQCLRFPLIYFFISLTYQLIFNQHVKWPMTIIISICMILFLAIYEWTKTPYQYNQDK